MSEGSVTLKRLGSVIFLLIAAALACNAPNSEPTEPPPPPTNSATPKATEQPAQPTVGAPETLPALVGSETAESTGETEGEPLPTFTRIQPPTLAATLTHTPTPKPAATVTRVVASPTPDADAGPLYFEYHFSWRYKEGNDLQAIATVTITAHGGSGRYVYYRDGERVDGPVFEYEWGTCSGNPGTFRVESADGQFAEEKYFQSPKDFLTDPPC